MTASKSVRKTINKQDQSVLRTQKKADKLKKCLFLEESDQGFKRDSLGLLPDSCFDDYNDDGVDFLNNSKNNLTPLPYLDLHLPEYPKNICEKLFSDISVREKLRNLLLTHNRHLVWNVLQKLSDDLHLDVIKNVYDQTNNRM